MISFLKVAEQIDKKLPITKDAFASNLKSHGKI